MCVFVFMQVNVHYSKSLYCVCLCVCAYMSVCILLRCVTLAGCAGVTCPLRSSTGVHVEDGMLHTVDTV